jgi:hypothetical protein
MSTTENTVKRWIVHRYTVVTMLPGDNYEAVFYDCDDDEYNAATLDKAQQAKLERTEDVEFVGMANVAAKYFLRNIDGKTRLTKTEDAGYQIFVGLILDEDGSCEVVNEMSNFVRMQRKMGKVQ